MNIILVGYTGRMGQMMIAAAEKKGDMITGGIAADCTETGTQWCSRFEDCQAAGDVVIDFSNHACTQDLLQYCRKRNLPVVICTTGQTEEEHELIRQATTEIPVFYSANMSLGIAVLNDLVKKAAMMFPEADIEIVEKHHNRKQDVPSGTALAIAETIKEVRPTAVFNIGRSQNGMRTKNEIGILSLRMGNEVGTHEVYIHTGSECITLSHEAESREIFADGALKAAAFLLGKDAGLYTMKDLLEE